ncbi:alpha-L-fucosidase [Flavobacterium flevense]|uniref:alpha-L-fucosidase n=1 Tax=Flavobacterium flevense TaxID=983 RepID=A0A4Y4AZZ8_9FLAO|nr:alpha-L-fucosidase [Flavobacterium flevense]GEC72013.1 alpha-L-fucosidase [Flavobacterium flevense]SHL93652.1 alpha-L-fucosidase [Flavobacterium flevense]
MKNIKKINLSILILIIAGQFLFAQNKTQSLSQDAKMEWWRDARFGMFIHFGVYAQFAGKYNGIEQRVADGAWLLNRMKVPVQVYKDTARNFNPIKYNSDEWVQVAKKAGMKYIVITAKHHDGFALFDSKASDWDVVDATKYGKDILKPLAEACKKQGLKLGFYYSQEQDWGNPGGAAHRRPMKQGWDNPDSTKIDNYTLAHKGHWDPVQDIKTFDEYINQVAIPQVKELLANYGDVAVIWWDTPAYITNEQAQKLKDVLKPYPNVITNDRLSKKSNFQGDYKTPEQKIPNLAELDGKDWENCMTMNNSWGFRSNDNKWKSSTMLIQNLIDIASKGGNYLLNVGPKADGTFPQESVNRLNDIGNWMKKYSVAIYGTHANPIENIDYGRITAKDDENSTTLYLSVFNWPVNGKLEIKGLSAKAVSATLIGEKKKLILKQDLDGNLQITDLPTIAPDKSASVISIKLNKIIVKKIFNPTKKMKSEALD